VRLTAVYDPIVAATMRERTFRSLLVARVSAHGQPKRVLDLGTGTGSLAIACQQADRSIAVTGLDPDPKALARARAKASQRSAIDWVKGSCLELPFADQSFDAVTCSLMLHHLDSEHKRLALAEALRVLTPGGWLHVADWGAARDPVMWLAFLTIRLLDGFDRTRAHAAGALPGMIEAAGFAEVQAYRRLRTCWGPLELTAARAPRGDDRGPAPTPSASAAVSL
jgi:SAM-dependent methyltransferase